MAFFIVHIADEILDFENITPILVECQKEDIGERCEAIARNWYGSEGDLEDEDDEDCGRYVNRNGNVSYVDDFHQITEACYQELKGFLSPL